MKKALKYKAVDRPYHFKDGVRVEGVHDEIEGDVTGIEGDVTDIEGDVSGIWGDVNGIWGNATFISGNLDDCELSSEDRERGVNIKDLIGELE